MNGWLSTLLGGAGQVGQYIASGTEQAGQYVAENPNLQQALAQMGTELDPQGAGGTIGRAASGMIQRQGQQAMMKQLLDALGEGGKVKQGADGTVEMTKGKESESDKSALAEKSVESPIDSQSKFPVKTSDDRGFSLDSSSPEVMSFDDATNWLNTEMGFGE